MRSRSPAPTRAEVTTYAADPDNATAWYENIKAVEWRSPRPLAVDSRIALWATFLGRHIAYTYAIREHTPGERLQMSTVEGLFPMETTYTWRDAAADGGIVMTLRNRGEPAGFARIRGPLMARAIQRANRKDLTGAQDDPRVAPWRTRRDPSWVDLTPWLSES